MNKLYDKMFVKNENNKKYEQLSKILFATHKANKDIKNINDCVTKGTIKL